MPLLLAKSWMVKIKHSGKRQNTWCHNYNLSLSINKSKEPHVDFGKGKSVDYMPVPIDGSAVETNNNFKFLDVTITNDVS